MSKDCSKGKSGIRRRRFESLRQFGITRLEILAVLFVAILVGLYLANSVFIRLDEARAEKITGDLERIAAALHQYKLDNQHYPFDEDGLSALLVASDADRSNWNGPYLSRENLLLDPWKRPYQYRGSNAPPSFEIFSLGADGKEGGEEADADVRLRFSSSRDVPDL